MKKIYIVYVEEHGEIEGAFDENDTLIHWWCCNDAQWRNEYFAPLMRELGYDFKHSDREDLKNILNSMAEELFG